VENRAKRRWGWPVIRPLEKSAKGYIYKNTKTKSGAKVGRPRGSRNSRKVVKRKRGTVPAKQPAQRGPGNHQGQAPLSPQVSKEIAKLWLIGTSLGQIAEEVGVHKSALSRHVSNHLLPTFRAALGSEATRVAALLREASRIAWQRVLEDRTDSDSLKLFCWSCDNLLSIAGARAPLRIDVENQYRVAGSNRQELESSMLARLAAKIEDLRYTAVQTIDAEHFANLEE
jgi:hypothetical protein